MALKIARSVLRLDSPCYLQFRSAPLRDLGSILYVSQLEYVPVGRNALSVGFTAVFERGMHGPVWVSGLKTVAFIDPESVGRPLDRSVRYVFVRNELTGMQTLELGNGWATIKAPDSIFCSIDFRAAGHDSRTIGLLTTRLRAGHVARNPGIIGASQTEAAYVKRLLEQHKGSCPMINGNDS
jgi:hypothetical protein